MILIADSGSTKTSWILIDEKGQEGPWETIGLNPFFHNLDSIKGEVIQHLLPHLDESPEMIYFYGSGCKSSENKATMKKALESVFPNVQAEVDHDLSGAAHALCQNNAGIVCILGTGSNSCVYDGQTITDQHASLGFVLGDEGSGAVLGTWIVRDYLYRRLPEDLQQAFEESNPMDFQDIIKRVYMSPYPNRFLAKFSRFIHEHRNHPYISDRLTSHFQEFLKRNVVSYRKPNLKAHFMGSIAFYFQEEIQKICAEEGIKVGEISQDALSGLIQYHRNLLR